MLDIQEPVFVRINHYYLNFLLTVMYNQCNVGFDFVYVRCTANTLMLLLLNVNKLYANC